MLVNTYSCRSVTLAGGIILSSGLILSFFTNSIQALYFTYGFLGGIGSGLCLATGLYLISQYFQKRRGVATGISMAASSAGQVAFPYLLQYMLDEYSYRGCILLLGGITMNICVSAALYRPLEDNFKKSTNKSKILDVKSKKRKRTFSQSTSRGSSQSFLAELNGFADLSTTVLQNKMNNASSERSSRKRKKKGKSKKSNNQHKNSSENSSSFLLKADRNLINGPQSLLTAENLQVSARNRSRTMSIESNFILPGIPEEEHEDDEEAVNEQTNLVDESEIIHNVGPNAMEILPSEKNEAISYFNNNISSNEKLACTRPLLPEDITVIVTVVDDEDDDVESASKYVTALQRQSSNNINNYCDENQVSCIHHPFGSIASIASTVKEAAPIARQSLLKRISTALGFNYFKNGIFHILSFSFTCLIVILSSYTMYMPTYGYTIGLTREDSAGLVSFISIASMCGRLIVPAVPDYINVKRKHIYFGCTLVLSAAIIMTAYAEGYAMLIASLVMFGFTSGGSIAISLTVYLEYIPVKDFASFFGLSQLVVGVVVLFSSPLFGLLLVSKSGYNTAYFIMSSLALLSGGVLFLDRFVKKIDQPTQS
ncbi:hypothetical protein CHUAL_008755 [Chamberlinius hualienensis]